MSRSSIPTLLIAALAFLVPLVARGAPYQSSDNQGEPQVSQGRQLNSIEAYLSRQNVNDSRNQKQTGESASSATTQTRMLNGFGYGNSDLSPVQLEGGANYGNSRVDHLLGYARQKGYGSHRESYNYESNDQLSSYSRVPQQQMEVVVLGQPDVKLFKKKFRGARGGKSTYKTVIAFGGSREPTGGKLYNPEGFLQQQASYPIISKPEELSYDVNKLLAEIDHTAREHSLVAPAHEVIDETIEINSGTTVIEGSKIKELPFESVKERKEVSVAKTPVVETVSTSITKGAPWGETSETSQKVVTKTVADAIINEKKAHPKDPPEKTSVIVEDKVVVKEPAVVLPAVEKVEKVEKVAEKESVALPAVEKVTVAETAVLPIAEVVESKELVASGDKKIAEAAPVLTEVEKVAVVSGAPLEKTKEKA